ncbi:PREDICTED: tripartite motif-containing protein 16-like [Cyprinodon variegatus]|uniref:Tripartite motif-containing protein 16-like n=1 Tax=Cyprinodon variegatus TaxID=28743 RepID=A0A3Q2E8V8_CYPVA|nr:PREDICTED: tripartite motif-containing protein 16-like [Cyprinodon variegatus]
MASTWPEEESFACSVCLETLKDPITLTCGHSYCLNCIENHWDKEDGKGQYSCPQCRQLFAPRPSVAKNTLLEQAMEKLRTNSLKQNHAVGIYSSEPALPFYLDLSDVGPRKGSVYPQLPSMEPRPCPKHKQPLDLFCHEDKECVCVMCCQQGHPGHHVVRPQEERREKQKELVQMQSEVQRRIQETERKIMEVPHTARQQKALLQALQRESSDLFPELGKSVDLTGTQVGELLSAHEAVFDGRVDELVKSLEQDVAQLHHRSEELNRLAYMQDNISFLKNFFLIEPLGQTGGPGQFGISQEEAVASIRSVIKDLQESVQELCKDSLAKIVKIVSHEPVAATPNGVAVKTETTVPTDHSCQATTQDSVYEEIDTSPPLPSQPPPSHEPPRFRGSINYQASGPAPPLPPPRPLASGTSIRLVNPEPKTREDMLKFRFEPTMDPNTAHRHMKLSEDLHKVTMCAENFNPPDHPDRFFFWRQVLCKEPLAGSPYYWEAEWTGKKITIGVAYKEMERKGSDHRSRLGHNAQSWSLYWSGTGFSFWHNNQEKLLGSPKAHRIGIYLDQHAGILNFYGIIGNNAHLIHHYVTQFTGPLFAGFRLWGGVGETLTICSLD